MFNDQHRIALVPQFHQHFQQLFDVRDMQPGGGFVQNVNGMTPGDARQFCRQFYALGFTAGKGGGGLPQLDVAKPHFLQGLEFAFDRGDGIEKLAGFGNGHFQHVRNIFLLVINAQSL